MGSCHLRDVTEAKLLLWLVEDDDAGPSVVLATAVDPMWRTGS